MNDNEIYGVYDNEFNIIFPESVSLSATVNEDSEIMSHPVEDGSMISDHKVIRPIEISLSLFLPTNKYGDIYKLIQQAFLGDSLYIVHTKTGVYKNMAIVSMPHEETTSQFDSVTIALQLKEVKIVETQYQALPPRKVADPKDQSTVNAGEQKPKEEESTAYGMAGKKVEELLGVNK